MNDGAAERREITRDEVKALMDYVATTDGEAYTPERLRSVAS